MKYFKKQEEELGSPRFKQKEEIQEARERMEFKPSPRPEELKPEKSRLKEDLARKALIRRIIYAVGGVLVIGILAVVIILWNQSRSTVNPRQIDIKMSAPAEIVSGEEIEYLIEYQNKSNIAWEDVELNFSYPTGFNFVSASRDSADPEAPKRFLVGKLDPNQKEDLIIKGRTVSEEGQEATVSCEISLKPANSSARMTKTAAVSSTIRSIPISLNLEVPQYVASGERTEYKLRFENNSKENFDNLRFIFEYPAGFDFKEGTPAPTEGNNIWDVLELKSGQAGEITVVGSLTGASEEFKPLYVKLGRMSDSGEFIFQKEVHGTTQISKKVLSVLNKINDSADEEFIAGPGDRIRGTIEYENSGNVAVGDVIVKLKLTGAILDQEKVFGDKGHYDSKANEIIWTSANVPELRILAPGAKGTLKYELAVKGEASVVVPDDKNFAIESIATIDSPEIPAPPGGEKIVETSRITIKVRSSIKLLVDTFYDDGRKSERMKSTGPIPPKVGQTTTYTIRMRVENTVNDLKDVRVAAEIPAGTTYTGENLVEFGDDLVYNERVAEITWNIPLIPAHSGILFPMPEAGFQVKITPSANQVGQKIILLKSAKISGKDVFTDEEFSDAVGELDTNDAVNQQGTVQR